MLSSLIRLPVSVEPSSTEDIFSFAVGLIFTDDLCNQHGDPGSSVVYKSKAYGDLELRLVDPGGEDARKLFAQYLWNSGVLMAEFIGGGTQDGEAMKTKGYNWTVKGEKVLELGAGIGTGLAGIVCTLSGAEETVVSDYPAKEILANIRINIERNMPTKLRSKVLVEGHEWGVLTDAYAQSKKNHFSRILAADCLWMPWQHENLAKSMLHFLSYDTDARIWVIAGFHTGRAKLAPFFKVAVHCGLDIEAVWERDCDGKEREWVEERDGGREDVTERKKWLVIAILRRSQTSHAIQNIAHQ